MDTNTAPMQAADEWARDHLQDMRSANRTRRVSFTMTDLVLAFEAGVSWERDRGLSNIRQRTDNLRRGVRDTPRHRKRQ